MIEKETVFALTLVITIILGVLSVKYKWKIADYF